MEEQHYIRVILCLSIVAAVLAVVAGVFVVRYIALRRKNRDGKFVKWAISRIEADNAFLYKVLGKPYDNNRGGDLKDEETVFVLTKRLKLLDKVLVSVISGNASLNGDVRNDLLSYVSDKDKFIHDTYHQYKRLHPRFVAFLRSKGLSEWETGYCCLYALGLRGKDVGAFLERGGHYNIDSRIRRKLGLGTEDANLGNYVRSRLKELSD
ncbi:MAG: hypothetical protein IAB93_07490 [Bacteroidetes bacterium]|uniref:Uncharacterized protein n=1 Tax=Candidatus Merdivivens pullistercoris TaxID=2840873 RepID=A0A9D9I6A3_9BACT|nr:hypothetical protein [Candidatus Merdivivens pullistercoris]